jgi:hypothetical protein
MKIEIHHGDEVGMKFWLLVYPLPFSFINCPERNQKIHSYLLLSNHPYYIRPEGFLVKFVLDVTLENLHQFDGAYNY